MKRILTGITTSGTPHIGNYLGAIKPSLELAKTNDESFFFLADYHSIIKTHDTQKIKSSVSEVALAWLSSGLDVEKSFFYRQSGLPGCPRKRSHRPQPGARELCAHFPDDAR